MLVRRAAPLPFLDEYGVVRGESVAEKIRVDINGVRQGMVIRGVDATNLVLQIVHGGPGMPDCFLNQSHPTGPVRPGHPWAQAL